MNTFYAYWGKAKKSPNIPSADYHLLPYHCLDVAAVGWHLLDPTQPLCKQLAFALDVEPSWLRTWFSFCLALHDLGKFFRAFQNLSPNMSDDLVPFDGRCSYDKRHDTLGYALWSELIKRLDDVIPRILSKPIDAWMQITCGHHGKPPEQFKAYTKCLLAADEEAAEAFVREACALWMPDLQPLQAIDKKVMRRCSWQLAGLAVLADWLGSNQEHFRYYSQPQPLQEYWQHVALSSAKTALKQANFAQRSINIFESIEQQFSFIKSPTPLQAYAQSVTIPSGPQLFILEDVTGAGKTEAAMVLVHRLLSQGLANGLYVGLPTMATANGMYKRMAQSYRQLFADHELPSLVLAHGASELTKEFQDSVALSAQLQDQNYADKELSASAYCNQWLADSRKKALLADVGVGTIDQALLGVLPAKHQALRLYGLTGKVLVVDEVHAFDPYMRRLLSALMSAHAAQGGSVILLSATLPLDFRRDLVVAYAEGSRHGAPRLNPAAQYPWVTQLNATGLSETPVATRPSVARHVHVERLDNEHVAMTVIKSAVALGRCVCWIRNTVKEAAEAYTQIKKSNVTAAQKLTLFHSRYAMIDRQIVEADVLERFGKNSGRVQRTGQVLIATQVVEQSLDLDFDVLITDLAPIDLLIQRAGRLQRHTRSCAGDIQKDEERPKPCLYLLAPNPLKVVNANWLRDALPGTQAVYKNTGRLWLSVQSILHTQGFSMPQDARRLIESVYGEEAEDLIPDVLQQDTQQAQAQSNAEAGMGRFNLLKLEKGYTTSSALHNGGWADEVNIPTRLGGDTVMCVLLKKDHNQWAPYAQATQHQWALSQISLPRKEWEQAQKRIPSSIQKELTQLKEQNNTLCWLELLPLEGELKKCYSASDGWRIPEKDSL